MEPWSYHNSLLAAEAPGCGNVLCMSRGRLQNLAGSPTGDRAGRVVFIIIIIVMCMCIVIIIIIVIIISIVSIISISIIIIIMRCIMIHNMITNTGRLEETCERRIANGSCTSGLSLSLYIYI